MFPIGVSHSLPSLLVQASQAQQNTTFFRNETGWSTRANFGFDIASNTAYGPLIGHFDINVDASNGFDALEGPPTANIAYLNTGYLTWAGITAGKAAVVLLVHRRRRQLGQLSSRPTARASTSLTCSLTPLRSAAASRPRYRRKARARPALRRRHANDRRGGSTRITFGGQRWPDIVGALHVKQGWGEAQVSGVIHDVNVADNTYDGAGDVRRWGLLGCNGSSRPRSAGASTRA